MMSWERADAAGAPVRVRTEGTPSPGAVAPGRAHPGVPLIDRLAAGGTLSRGEFAYLLEHRDEELRDYLFARAREVKRRWFGNKVYIRGLIEFTNYCKNDCYYCGIRRGNSNASRYRLSEEQILACCEAGHALGFRTFVLQGGEDPYFTDARIVALVRGIKERFPDCAVTLSIGEKERESYEAYFAAGADRYLLRHETADRAHYELLHPSNLSFDHRRDCLKNLKEIGFQTGAGFMVGSPGQTLESLLDDLEYLLSLIHI